MSTVASGSTVVKASTAKPAAKPGLDAWVEKINRERAKMGFEPITDPKDVIRHKMYAVYVDGTWNRRLERVLGLLMRARDALTELSEVDEYYEITSDWAKAGLQPEAEEDDDERRLDIARWLREDATGAAWALTAYIQQLDSNIAGRPRARRTRRRGR